MDVLTLSRIQFTLTISFHYIYPPLSIGLGVILVIIEGLAEGIFAFFLESGFLAAAPRESGGKSKRHDCPGRFDPGC
jgi:cytochrome bd-type quinol oxidase subunit 1